MSHHENTSHHAYIQKGHINSMTYTVASPVKSSSHPINNPSEAEPQSSSAAWPRNNASHSDSEWTMIGPDPSFHPAVTTSLRNHAGGIEQANITGPSTLLADVRSHLRSKHKRSGSPASSPQAHTAPSPKTQATASQIALRKELLEQDLAFREHIARKTLAEEDSDSGTDNISDSSSDSDSSQLDMADNPYNIRKELEENFMFVGGDQLNHPDNIEFKEKIIKVVKSDRKSVVSKEDLVNFEVDYKTYKLTNEQTLTFMLVPIIMGRKFTAQDVDQDGRPYGEFKTRDFTQQGVRVSLDHLYAPYCLPHRLMNILKVPRSMIEEHFKSSKALSTPKPDFSYGLNEEILPKVPSDIKLSEKINLLLKVAHIREVFFVWENKSGAGILMKCENQAIKDVSAVIYAKRQLHEYMGRANTPGIDKETFVYAATNDNRQLDIWVAYAWLPKDLSRVEFHMERIDSNDFSSIDELEQDPNTLANIRKPLHNIIEWGSIARIPKMNKFYSELWEVEREMFNKSLIKEREEEAKAEAEAEGSKKKKKKTH